MAELVAGKRVKIKEKGKYRYKRVFGVVFLNKSDINEQKDAKTA
nr:hypothetical protein [uncultured Campylobacter sp.]